MRQRAILLSLTLHAGVIAWSAHPWSSGPRHEQPPGLSVSLGAEEGANPLLAEPGESAPPPLEATFAEEEFTPPPPQTLNRQEAVQPLSAITPLVSAAPLLPSVAVPQDAPAVVKKKAERHPERSAMNKRESSRSAASPTPGAGAGGAGTSEGGTGGQAGGGGGYQPPRYLLRYKPLYPPAARAQHLEGTALIWVSVDLAGRVTRAVLRQSSGHALLDRAALEAVRSWHFEPARQHGTAIASEVELPVSFRFVK